MKLDFRRRSDEETDIELVFGVLFIPILSVAIFALSKIPPSWLPRCMLHTSFGIPCPTCGACRSMRLLVGGHPVNAWLMQPLVVTLAAIGVCYCAYSFIVVFGRLPRIRLEDISRSEKRVMVILAAALLIANWLYLAYNGA